jgi:hypothetical protein
LELAVDHLVVAVGDLEAATETYRRLGFTLHPGRRHANSLRNAFVKLADGAEIELISAERAADALSSQYLEFLQGGEGGAFLALTAGPVDQVARCLPAEQWQPRIQRGRAFDYLTFPDEPGLAHLFFIHYHHRPAVPDASRLHANGATGISEVWLDGSPRLRQLLRQLGAEDRGQGVHETGVRGRRFALDRGGVSLVAAEPGGSGVAGLTPARPRLLAVTLRPGSMESVADSQFPVLARGLWLSW